MLTTDRGRIVDLLSVVHAGEYILLITSPGRQQPVIDWLDKYTIMENMEVTDISESTAVVALAGSRRRRPLGPGRGGAGLPPRPPVSRAHGQHRRGRRHIREPSAGQHLPCRLLLTDAAAAPALTAALADAGAVTADADAWDALRISAGAPAFGAEMGEPYNPLEAGLIGAIDFTKGCYIGQEVIARLDSYHKVQKRLAALSFARRQRRRPRRIANPRRQDPPERLPPCTAPPMGTCAAWGTSAPPPPSPAKPCNCKPRQPAPPPLTIPPRLFGPGQDFT